MYKRQTLCELRLCHETFVAAQWDLSALNLTVLLPVKEGRIQVSVTVECVVAWPSWSQRGYAGCSLRVPYVCTLRVKDTLQGQTGDALQDTELYRIAGTEMHTCTKATAAVHAQKPLQLVPEAIYHRLNFLLFRVVALSLDFKLTSQRGQTLHQLLPLGFRGGFHVGHTESPFALTLQSC